LWALCFRKRKITNWNSGTGLQRGLARADYPSLKVGIHDVTALAVSFLNCPYFWLVCWIIITKLNSVSQNRKCAHFRIFNNIPTAMSDGYILHLLHSALMHVTSDSSVASMSMGLTQAGTRHHKQTCSKYFVFLTST
jgi:hypothetical protein